MRNHFKFGISLVCLFGLCLPATSQQKAPTTSSKTAFTTSTKPFDLSRTNVGAMFGGNSVATIYAALEHHTQAFSKSEFETTSAFADRLSTFDRSALSMGMKPNDTYAFMVNPDVTYDADSRKMRISISSDLLGPNKSIWSSTSISKGSYIGSNSFGVKRSIKRLETTQYSIEFDNPDWLSSEYHRETYSSENGFVLTEEGSAAHRFSYALRVILIGNLAFPYATHESSPGEPTISYPVDHSVVDRTVHLSLKAVWLVDAVSGDVVQKYSEEGFENKWPVRAQLTCGTCNEFSLNVTVDGHSIEDSHLRKDSDRTAPIEIHAREKIILNLHDIYGEASKWKVTSDGIDEQWHCEDQKAYSSFQDCYIVIRGVSSTGNSGELPISKERSSTVPTMRISSGVAAGNVLTRVTPTYPAIALAAHVAGAIVIHAIISPSGHVESAIPISGPEMLRSSALQAVQQWIFKPYVLNGSPVRVDTTLTINFTLPN